MNALAGRAPDALLAAFDAARADLPGDAQARGQAAAALRRMGLPTRRDEAWHYTNLRGALAARYAEPVEGGSSLPALPEIDGPRLVFVDGFFRADLSRLPEGVATGRTADAAPRAALARIDRDPMAALNAMLWRDGVTVVVPAGHDAGVLTLVSVATGGGDVPAAFHPRHTIDLAEGAALTLLDIAAGVGDYLSNVVIEARVDAGATLRHVRLQQESRTAVSVATMYADIAESGTYDAFTLNLGARLARTEAHARLGGERAATHLNAAQLLGDGQHGDFTTVVSHDAPHCASRQTVKNVLSGKSRGVFQGKIEVARGAQKTDGYQMNQALLLSPEAEIDSKPQLEIYADDVKCSHGATVGELDVDQMFYLRSRGVPEAEARALLVRAFLADALEAVADLRVRAVLEAALEDWWRAQP
jgi:Fe-S cluster assembly protein SufD